MKGIVILFFLFVFANCQTIIKITSAKYELKCNKLKEVVTFILPLEYEGEKVLIDPFEITMESAEANNHNGNAKCVYNEDEDNLVCQFTAAEAGVYYPLLESDIKDYDYTILAFDLENYPIGFINKEYNPPKMEHYSETIYHSKSVTEETLGLWFTNTFSATTPLPIVFLGDDILDCQPEIDTETLNCKIPLEDFPIRDNPYSGKIISICGIEDSTITLYMKKGRTIEVRVDGFSDIRKEINCIKSLPKESIVELDYLKNGEIGEKSYNVDGEVLFMHEDGKGNTETITTKCILDETYFNCTTMEDSHEEGKYYGVMDNYTIERDEGDIFMPSFNTSNYLQINKNYVPLKTDLIRIKHNYTDSNEGSFNIEYTENIPQAFIVRFTTDKEINLECSTNGKNENCKFKSKDLPNTNPNNYTIYEGEILNACGVKEGTIEINVTGNKGKFIAYNWVVLIAFSIISLLF